MKLSDLQSWLLNEGVRDSLDALTQRLVASELDNVVADENGASAEIDWPRLLLAGSILSRSDLREHQEAALQIATSAVSLSGAPSIQDAGAVLLGQLSNFRAVALADRRKLLTSNLDERLGVSLRIEAQRRRLDQSVLIESSGQWLNVNDFQKRFWSDASEHQWLSASAPTASGKTYLVLQWIIDQVLSHDVRVVVYLAPTRALVTEIEASLKSLLGNNGAIDVSSLPLREKYDAARAGQRRLVMIFTQERLHLLANALGDTMTADLLVVDEAHKIGDHQRGVILQDAIERVCRANASVKVVFISPATQNPEELLADAPTGASAVAINSDAPTVLQNLIVAEPTTGKPKRWRLSVLRRGSRLPVGVLQLASSPSGLRKRLAFISAAVGERGGTLVYANGAAEAEAVADLISQLLPQPVGSDSELGELADLARKGVHPKYLLASLVTRGVAFHYGNMPSLIRLEIERLFRSGKIRFLICTSTLIEGVNLSCRTIVLRGPRKGKGNPMEPHDFWNLAGRAGRWGDEFQGNIVCIEPDDANAWPNGVPARARYPIKRESDAVLKFGFELAAYLRRRADDELPERRELEKFEQVGAYLLATHLRLGSILSASFAIRHSHNVVLMLDQTLRNITAQIEIEPEVAARHPGVSALGLQRLLDEFRNYSGDVENLLPADVNSHDSFDRFVTIMRRINRHLFPAFLPDGLVPLHARVVVDWLRGRSLAAMIRSNIRYHETHGRPFELPTLIRETMDLVEQTARFKAPRYFSAYMDVLKLHLREIGRDDLVDDVGLDIATQLEFGVSAKTLVSLIELGLSRMSAVILYEKISRDDLDKNGCLEWVFERRSQLDNMNIPNVIVREIQEKFSIAEGDQAPVQEF